MSKNTKAVSLSAAGVFLFYWAFVLLSGRGFNLIGGDWNFTNSGQFGDSFGPLSSLMSTIAAVSAFMAYWTQRDELERLKNTSRDETDRANKRDFENTFFNLISLFRDTVRQIDIPTGTAGESYSGSDAFQIMINRYMDPSFYESAPKDHEKSYLQLYDKYKNDLGHYFRLFYHILKYIDEHSISEKKPYIRILRATLSNVEMVMIGLNCAYRPSGSKLKPLVEQYAILHNISSADAKKYRITSTMELSAFGDRNRREDGGLSP